MTITKDFIKKFNPYNCKKREILFEYLIKNNIDIFKGVANNYFFSDMFNLKILNINYIKNFIHDGVSKKIITNNSERKLLEIFEDSNILSIKSSINLYKLNYGPNPKKIKFRQILFFEEDIFFLYGNGSYYIINFEDIKDNIYNENLNNKIKLIYPKDINKYNIEKYEFFKINEEIILINPIIKDET